MKKRRFVRACFPHLFQRPVPNQGFYPGGIYTAPDDAALAHDIDLSIAMGMSGAEVPAIFLPEWMECVGCDYIFLRYAIPC